jgi:Carboxypeptidase regulatory-like domain
MQRLFRFSIGIVFLLVSAFAVGNAFGQGGATGAISGDVLDTQGGSISDAEVQIIYVATDSVARKISTGTDGTFVATLLPPGTYYVVVNKSGFAGVKVSAIEVRVTETTKISITLKAGAVSEKVEISAMVTTVETTNATTGQSISTETIRQLPLATQNYQQLLTLSTGAQSELNASAQLGRGNARVIVNGQREDNNNYLIEGISATDYNVAQATYIPLPNTDVIQEFKVQTSLYDASQGRNGGGNVNAILKSGTRNYHGDVYEFFRNDVLNANEYFLKAAGQDRPPVKQNTFGGSLGGPVVKEKYGFFFVNYQGTRQRSALSPGTQINNPAFPSLPTTRDAASIANALSTADFPIAPGDIDPVTLALLQFKSNQFGDASGFLIPSVGTPDLNPNKASYATAPYIFVKPGKYTDDQFTTNWDREFRGGQDKISARFFFSDAESLLPFGAGGLQASLGGTLASSISATDLNFPYDIPVSARFFTVNETHLFSPTLVNDFRFGFVHINDDLLNIPPVTADDLGIERPTNSVTQSIYKFTLGSSGFQLGPTPPADQKQNQDTYNFTDTVSWVHGKHVFRFGAEYSYISIDKLFPQVFNGQLFFVNTPGGATDFQKLLVGAPDFSFGGGGVFDHEYRNNDFGFFVQDDWKVHPNLTLNLGLRTEVLGAFYDNSCHIGNLDPDLANSGQYPFINSTCANKLGLTGLSGTANNTTFDNRYSTGLAPRIGLAYDLFGHHTTTIRSGYGIYYVREDVGTADQLSFQAPYLPVAFGGGAPGSLSNFFETGINALPQAGTLDPNFVPCLGAFQGFPGGDTTVFPNYGCAAGSPGVLPSQFIFGLTVPRKFVVPNTQQWNLTIQRALGKDWVLEVGYVGTHAVHLRETRTSIQAALASPTNPFILHGANCDGSVIDSAATCAITISTTGNGPARSLNSGINGYSGFQLFANDAYSHYNSLQTTLSRRWSAGYFQAAYTFSRSTDATSSGNTALNTAFNDESSLQASRGLSDFDRTHRLSVSYRYDLPFFKDSTGFKKAALGNWAISGITIIQSGSPFSVTDSAAGTAFLGPGLASATLGGQLAPGGSIAAGTTGGDIHSRLGAYLNINNFVPAPLVSAADGGDGSVTEFGNLGRNIYRGPYQQNWDFSLIKDFHITERQSLRFTTDFFNIWNHANFANPAINDVENPAAFGQIISTVGTPRLIQFSLRYSF